jgi:FkbM family methyltransferase
MAILGRAERPLLAWFRDNVKQGETWLDVGANYGYTAIALGVFVGGAGRVYAFEPSLTTLGYLNQTRTMNSLAQVTVVPFGLGTPGGLRVTSVPVVRGMANSLASEGTEDIYLMGFDDFWTQLGKRPVHGVKIDVQGMELDVLEGMTETLRDQHPKLVIEIHAGVDRHRFTEILRSLGYQLPGVSVQAAPVDHQLTYRDDWSYAFTHRTLKPDVAVAPIR